MSGADRTPPVLRTPFGSAVVAGTGVVLPSYGMASAADLLAPGPAHDFDAAAALGRKGLRYLDRATLLGAAAAEAALRDAGLAGADRSQPGRAGVGLVVASCYGNLGTVGRVAATIDAEGVGATSPMDLPNASSNVVASVIAIRNGIRGVCLSVCNGHASGWDALRWGLQLLESGRSDTVLVVGTETPSPQEQALRDPAPELVDGAVAVVLRAAGMPPATGPGSAPVLAPPLEKLETAGVGGVLDLCHAAAAVGGTGAPVRIAGPGGEWEVRP
jgi:3-oxoacyl-[acyl-carrier-protein] synthase II